MTIHTGEPGLEAKMVRVGKARLVFGGMTVGAHEGPVVGNVKCGGVYNVKRIHPLFNVPSRIFVEVGKILLPMTFEAFMIFFEGNRGYFRFILGCCKQTAHNY
jgi:hypothetical protein